VTVTLEQQETLRRMYREGESAAAAARAIGATAPTVLRYFARFADEGEPRGRLKYLSRVHDPRCWGPRYDGPDWIGERISE
jgi:hypothetical protein